VMWCVLQTLNNEGHECVLQFVLQCVAVYVAVRDVVCVANSEQRRTRDMSVCCSLCCSVLQ